MSVYSAAFRFGPTTTEYFDPQMSKAARPISFSVKGPAIGGCHMTRVSSVATVIAAGARSVQSSRAIENRVHVELNGDVPGDRHRVDQGVVCPPVVWMVNGEHVVWV